MLAVSLSSYGHCLIDRLLCLVYYYPDEVGMQEFGVRGFFCRLEHQRPTSDEVGMRQEIEHLRSCVVPLSLVGRSIRNQPLRRWVCAKNLTGHPLCEVTLTS